MTLDEAARDLVAVLQLTLQDVGQCTKSAQQGSSAESAVTYYQAVGICELLLDAEVDAFYDHLVRAAMMRRALLKLHRDKGGVPDRVRKASQRRGLNGAIAAGEWDLARAIATCSSREHLERVEYGEDFLIADFIHRYLMDEEPATLLDVVHAIDDALAGIVDPRRDLCQALLDRDESLAGAAFEDLIDAQQQYLSSMAQTSSVGGDPVFLPLSSIYVEGLAWLRLLDRQGVNLSDEYPMCPTMARLPRTRPFSGPSIPRFANRAPSLA